MAYVPTKFLSRYGPYFEGANPRLEDVLAKRLADQGFCKILTEQEAEADQRARRLKKAAPGSDDASAREKALAQEKLKLQAEREAFEKEKAAFEATKSPPPEPNAGPFDELKLDARLVNSLDAAGFKDIEALEEYATTNENFLEVEGIGEVSDEQIRKALNKRGKK